MTTTPSTPPNTINTTDIIILRIKNALIFAKISVSLNLLAVVCFCVFGTLSSMVRFHDSTVMYLLFHYLPYLLIGLSMPISLYHAFILARYRIIQRGILGLVLVVGLGLLFTAGVLLLKNGADTTAFMTLFLAMIAWFGMPFLFRVNFNKFLTFLTHSDFNK